MTDRPPGDFSLDEAASASGVHSATIRAWIAYGLGDLISAEVGAERRFTARHILMIAVGAALAACGYRELTALAAAFELSDQVKEDIIIVARPDGISTRSVRIATAADLASLAAPTESVLVIPAGAIARRIREALS